jgi:hypothetical protein
MADPDPITDTFARWRRGEPGALDALLPRVHGELRVPAGSHMRRERSDHTLHSKALAHEACLRLILRCEGLVQDRLDCRLEAVPSVKRDVGPPVRAKG